MKKILTIVGTRPEIIKLSRVISEFDKFTDHTLVHTGQNYDYELNQIFFDDLELRQPDHYLDAVGDSVAETIGLIIAKADNIMDQVKPDAILLYGDTNSCLSIIPAKRRKIPVFHMEAGNRSFDQRVPEELNRKVVDHLSDVNLVLSEHARRYLISEGIRPETIFKTGSHMKEVLDFYMHKINSSNILRELSLSSDSYFLVSLHREENIDSPSNLAMLLSSLNSIAYKYNLPVIVSTHPRTKKKLLSCNTDLELSPLIRFLKPFGFTDYIQLQQSAKLIISDSGTISEETSLLNLKSITVRSAHERPEGIDSGTLYLSSLDPDSVLHNISVVLSQSSSIQSRIGTVSDYHSENVSKKVLRIVLGYIDYINFYCWHK
ncbi:non-hydrolyzing UDP-N-acetylglucosamine 2-epimerase [Synechococcus sp. UW105]|uniref:non-hydrolyzing UDP-N-acetylglucosamine 2-epimerase n=1 Tax=Synechococcus sp. UW105 TaxID=337067 RepID=UPI000E0FB7BF|nr:UDP-N-acetylglucosamine 2-epimerase (non-hydrolyzing) [Synechococcus sp. UW105]